jgi:zinc protease
VATFETVGADHPPSSLAPFHRTYLPCEVPLIVREMPRASVTNVSIWCRTGSAHEPAAMNGISHFLEHMYFKGTDRYAPGDMDRVIKGLGGYNNAATSIEYTNYFATVPAENYHLALEVLADALLHSRFDPAEIERERQVVLEEIGRKEDDPQGKLFVEFQSDFGGTTPYGRPILGRAETLFRIDRDAFLAYLRDRYTAPNLCVVVAGRVAREDVAARAAEALAGTPPGTPNQVGTFGWLPLDRRERRVSREIRHAYLMLGFRTPGLGDQEEAFALEMVSAILGRGRSSRLVKRLREELGIVSGISAWTWDLSRGGMLTVSAGFEPDREAQVRAEIESHLARLQRETVSQEELARARTVASADFHFSTETPGDVGATLGHFHVTTRAEDAIEYLSRLQRVTPEQVRDAAKRWLDPAHAVITMVCPNTAAQEASAQATAAAQAESKVVRP